MSTYIAIYNGNSANITVKNTIAHIGNRPYVILLDLLLDGQCIELSNELKNMRYQTKIYEVMSQGLDDISFKLSAIRNEISMELLKNDKDDDEKFYFEVGGLNHVMAGAVFSAAFREGATVVYLEDDNKLRTVVFKQAPDVSRIGYYPRLALEKLHENGGLERSALAEMLYADQIVNLNEEEKEEFFRQNHNTYKVLENLEDRKWIKFENNAFHITELGNMARVMMNLKNEQESKNPSKKRGRRPGSSENA